MRRAGLMVLLALAGCEGDGRTPVLLYSPHGRDQLALLERDFEALNPDVDVRWLDMGSQEILDRLRFERVNPQADVWFGGPSAIFERGITDSLLMPYRPAWAGRVGPLGIGPADLYYPAYRTPAIIAYNNAAVPDSEAPGDWAEILDPRWRGKVLIRDPMASGTMRAIWGLFIERSLRETGDTSRAMQYLRQLDAWTTAYALNPAVLDEKLTRREGLITLWGLPDILISIGKGMPFGYTFPASGTVVIEDGIGLVRGAPHPDAARRFIDYVGSDHAQILTARKVFRLPSVHGLNPDSVPTWVTEVESRLTVYDMDWNQLSREGSAWMAYWDEHVRHTGSKAFPP